MPPDLPSMEGSRELLRWAKADLERRLRSGEPCGAGEYLSSHPALSDDPDKAVSLILAEWQTRRELGETPDVSEWCARFPRWRDLLQRRIGEMPTPAPHTTGETITRTGPPAPLSVAAVGDFRAGEHVIYEVIGEGGMGVVYRAYDTGLQREVALKMIKSGALAGPEVDRFFREARAAARLSHPNIVPIYAIGCYNGRPCYTMARVHTSLARELDRYRTDIRAPVAMMEKVARAVDAAHRAGIIHRDLKPGNILLTADGEPLVADFGLAKILDADADATRSGAVLGTPAYMAPEQVRGDGKTATAAADIWGMGVILYEVLTGTRPFHGDRVELPRRIAESEMPSMRARRPEVPRELEAVVWKCLEKEEKDRYATAGALADDLQRWLRNEPVAARPRPWVQRLRRSLARMSAWHALFLFALLIACLAVGLTLWQGGRDKHPDVDPPTRPLSREETERRQQQFLEEGRRRLDDGLPLILIDARGQEGWSRWATERERPLLAPAVAGHRFLQGFEEPCLLELAPRPLPQRFTLSADVQVVELASGSRVGLYALCDEADEEFGRTHRFLTLQLSEQNQGKEGLVSVALVRYQEPHPKRVTGGENFLATKPVPRPQLFDWRRLTLTVTPDEIKAQWGDDGLPVVSRRRLEVALRNLEARPKAGPRPPARPLDDRGAVGLYLRGAQARFRNVVLTPHPNP